MKKLLICFSSIACNSTTASNKQRQEHNILNTIPRAKLKEAYEHSKSLQFVKHRIQTQILTRMDKVVIEKYYHMTTMDKHLKCMKLTHVLSKFFSKP